MCLSDKELAAEIASIKNEIRRLEDQTREIEMAVDRHSRSFEYHRRTFRSLSSATVLLFAPTPGRGPGGRQP